MGYVSHQLLCFPVVASAIGVWADVSVKQFFENGSHLKITSLSTISFAVFAT